MNQRTAYRRYMEGEPSAMTVRRIKLLRKVGIQWLLRQMQWEHMKQQLMDFYAENGHINVPNELASYKLRIWLNQQRYYYKRRKDGLSSPMTPERIKMLETAIPDFSWRVRDNNGPSLQDWGKLFDDMRAKGLKPCMRPKTHWFEVTNPFAANIKDVW